MDGLLASLRAALAGRYDVAHEVGRGGMAVVVLAHDVRHDRKVAIKLLRHDLGSESAADRFLHEIRTVAPLHHPHILPLYDSGTAAGQLFFVMPFVEGESLRQRLERNGPLPLEDAIRIVREVADALEFAHQRGVIHRDIKPENILLSAGHATVADFGIARAMDKAGVKLTDTGLAVGTPTYMSPEQALADSALTAQSDQYALACVAYEMLTGQPPFTGSTSRAIMARHSVDPVPPMGTVRDLPAGLEEVLRRALSKSPADRWPTTRAFASAVESTIADRESQTKRPSTRSWVVPILLAASLVAAVGTAWWLGSQNRFRQGGAADDLESIAVLPFAFSGDSGFAGLADGMTEGLVTGLVQVSGLSVPSGVAGRVRAHAVPTADPAELGRVLGVDYVVSGDVQIRGASVRVTAQLVDVPSGRILWRSPFDGEIGDRLTADFFGIQGEIAERIVAAVLPELPIAKRASAARGIRTNDLEALRLYQEARALPYHRNDNDRAIALLERAVERDSAFADAWLEIAWRTGSRNEPASESALTWRGAIENVFRVDSTHPRALSERGFYRFLYEWNWSGAAADMRTAIQYGPSEPVVHASVSVLQILMGHLDSALIYARRSVRLDSLSAFAWGQLGFVHTFRGSPDSAIAAAERAIDVDSTAPNANWVLANMYLSLGRRSEADRAARRIANEYELSAPYYARIGDLARVRKMLDSLNERIARGEFVSPVVLGATRLAAGDQEGALDALEQAAQGRDLFIHDALSWIYTPLRGHPRYEAVRRRVRGNLPSLPPPF